MELSKTNSSQTQTNYSFKELQAHITKDLAILDSLAEMQPGTKYYYYAPDGKFYPPRVSEGLFRTVLRLSIENTLEGLTATKVEIQKTLLNAAHLIDPNHQKEIQNIVLPLFSKWGEVKAHLKVLEETYHSSGTKQPQIVGAVEDLVSGVQDSMTQVLLKMDDASLFKYFQGRSFLDEFGLTEEKINEKMTEDLKAILLRLVLLKTKETIQDLIRSPHLTDIFLSLMKQHPEKTNSSIQKWYATNLDLYLSPISEKFQYLDRFRVAIFIVENRVLIEQGFMGVPSKRRGDIRKIKGREVHIPMNLEYDRNKGEIVVSTGEVARSEFKVLKTHLFLTTSEMEAVTKQVLLNPEPKQIQYSEREVKMMEKCKGVEHIVQLHKATSYKHISASGVELVTTHFMHFYSMGNLREVLSKLSPSEKKQVAIDTVKGVIALHKLGIFHRDLKPENILLEKTIERDWSGVKTHAVVADLGLGCWMDGDPDIVDPVGTVKYKSERRLMHEIEEEKGTLPFTASDETWSVGVLLYEILFGEHFLKDINEGLIPAIQRLGHIEEYPEPQRPSFEHAVWHLLGPSRGEKSLQELGDPLLQEALEELERVQRLDKLEESVKGPGSALLDEYKGRSFLKENGLERLSNEEIDRKLTPLQKELLIKLLALKHSETIQELIHSKELVRIFLQEIAKSSSLIYEDPFDSWFSTFKNQNEVTRETLGMVSAFQLAVFVSQNRALIESGEMGEPTDRKDVRSIRGSDYQLPFNFEYNTVTQAIELK